MDWLFGLLALPAVLCGLGCLAMLVTAAFGARRAGGVSRGCHAGHAQPTPELEQSTQR